MKNPFRVSRGAAVLVFAMGSFACESASFIDGVVHAPAERCAPSDDENVTGAVVKLTCPPEANDAVMRPAGTRYPATGPANTDDKGNFQMTVKELGPALSTCRLSIQREGFDPFNQLISDLEQRKDAEKNGDTLYVHLRLRRKNAPP